MSSSLSGARHGAMHCCADPAGEVSRSTACAAGSLVVASGCSALGLDRLCPAGREEEAGFEHCPPGVQPAGHSISLGKLPVSERKWATQSRQDQNVQASLLAGYVQMEELVLRQLTLQNPPSPCVQLFPRGAEGPSCSSPYAPCHRDLSNSCTFVPLHGSCLTVK